MPSGPRVPSPRTPRWPPSSPHLRPSARSWWVTWWRVCGTSTSPLLLVVDDVHHLRSEPALADLQSLMAESLPRLHVVLVSRRDPKLRLHRAAAVRLSSSEIRSADLEFTRRGGRRASGGSRRRASATTRSPACTRGRRAGQPDSGSLRCRWHGTTHPREFVAEFAGSERTVADYLLGEVLHSASRRRSVTCCCGPASSTGSPASSPTCSPDGARRAAAARARRGQRPGGRRRTSLVPRSATTSCSLDLLRLELRRELPGEIESLHRLAATVVRRPRPGRRRASGTPALAGDWALACELLGRHWVQLLLDGEETTLSRSARRRPADLVDADAEVATMLAADRLRHRPLGRGGRAARRGPARPSTPFLPSRRSRARDRAGDRAAVPRPPVRRDRGGRRRGAQRGRALPRRRPSRGRRSRRPGAPQPRRRQSVDLPLRRGRARPRARTGPRSHDRPARTSRSAA